MEGEGGRTFREVGEGYKQTRGKGREVVRTLRGVSGGYKLARGKA